MTDFPRTRERLEYELEDGGFTRGAKVVVEVAGERLLDIAVGDNGLGAPLTPEHILRVYCTIKPLLTSSSPSSSKTEPSASTNPSANGSPTCDRSTAGRPCATC